jgi:hypothetical protein
VSVEFHLCDMSAYGLEPSPCVCAIGRDHDADEMEAWEANGWADPGEPE